MTGRKHSAETIAKMSASAKGKTKSPEHRAALSAALKGRSLPEDAPQRIKGRALSEETKAKLRGRHHTEETKIRIGESLKTSSAHQAAMRSEERSQKISQALTGHLVTQETRDKIADKIRPLAPFNFRGGHIAEIYAAFLCPAGFIREHHVLWGRGNDRFRLDFAHLEGKINIELDGESHDNSHAHDALRDSMLKTLGWRIIRIKL